MRAGYLCDGLCVCGQPDIAHHRLYSCQLPRVVEAREAAEVMAPAFLNAALDNPDLPISTSGVHVYTDSELPCPLVSSEVYLYDRDGNALDMQPEEIA
eukprot:6755524-Pyramimonas_sp.AAC.1